MPLSRVRTVSERAGGGKAMIDNGSGGVDSFCTLFSSAETCRFRSVDTGLVAPGITRPLAGRGYGETGPVTRSGAPCCRSTAGTLNPPSAP